MQVRLDLLRSANKAAVSTLVPPERPQYKVLQSKERLRMMLAQAQQVRFKVHLIKSAEASYLQHSKRESFSSFHWEPLQIAEEKRSDADRARLKAAEEDARMAAWSSRRIKELA